MARRCPRDRQGYPEVPRGLLAHHAARGRHRAAKAGRRPWMVAEGGRQNQQGHGQHCGPGGDH